MKEQLIGLGLSEDCVEDLLEAFETYDGAVSRLSKPPGAGSMHKNLGEVEDLAKRLLSKIEDLTALERQHLDFRVPQNTRDMVVALRKLSSACETVRRTGFKFSRKRPFLTTLAREVQEVLNRHGHPVKLYRNNIFVQVMDLLIEQPSENESFELLRKISKKSL